MVSSALKLFFPSPLEMRDEVGRRLLLMTRVFLDFFFQVLDKLFFYYSVEAKYNMHAVAVHKQTHANKTKEHVVLKQTVEIILGTRH